MVRVAGLVLAAGQGRRFGQPKALVVVDGQRLVDRAVNLLADGRCRPLLVVSGAAPISVAQAAVVHNPHWAGGMSSSLRVGLGAMPDDATAVVVTLVDTPWVGPEAVTRLITAHQDGAELAVATYDGVRGHPVLLGREHWQGVIDLSHDDVGARAYLAQYPDGVAEIDCTSTGDPSDVDTPDDL